LTSVIEQTLKALTEFESELDAAKAEAVEARKKLLKNANDWAAAASSKAMAEAQENASQTIARARAEAEKDAESIRRKGEATLKSFEASISKRKGRAAEIVAARLRGEGP
jgi:vacuolar-type H+-ATPase subunit H